MTPGNNLLRQALRVISSAQFQYVAFQGRKLNEIAMYVNHYAPPVNTSGSVQAIPKRLYEMLGLNLQKTYFNFFLPQTVLDVGRDVSSDYFVWNGNTYRCESIVPWFAIDGWVEVLTILTPPQELGLC